MPRPFWSGQIQISLVSFSVNLFPAVEAKSEIHFHQLSRKTGERIHHQKVSGEDPSEGDPVEKDDIVKGYEYSKGEYVMIESSEIENLRIPSRHALVISQFIDLDELHPAFFEKPYFVAPDGDSQTEAFTVIRKALQSTKKAALGKIAFGGREHLVAISVPPEEKIESAANRGMMAYTLRYAEELRDPAEYFSEIKKTAVDSDQLTLAKELIQRKTARFAPEKFHDEYEAALKELVEAKVNNAPLPKEERPRRSGKVINLMDALRESVSSRADDSGDVRSRKSAKKEAVAPKKGMSLVKAGAKSKSSRNRKSA
ncbi:non-homologous end joining protein Ku [Acidicapsa ligni]|uniref:non-homologous end joining protein Ku n=1 Tax=Acidicapsa ligni TaxID=542300 RepID=UPI0021DFDBFA|nr:Ku protein [Acidicapsa ligni]